MQFETLSESNGINRQLQHTPIAIIGMASIFPQARNMREYWENIVRKIDCITEVPPSHWEVEDYYDPDLNTPDKTYCKRGGFIPDVVFDPLEFGLPPNILEVTDVSQLLSLVVAKEALCDAGYSEGKDFNRERTGVILGVVGGTQKLLISLASRLQFPVWEKVLKSSGLSAAEVQKIIEKIKLAYVGWEENAFPGWLGNVVAGRIANRLDLGGTNCVVDAACASSLSAIKMAISELLEYRCDLMITGGVDTNNSIPIYMSFSKTPALSRKQQVRPFDADADGTMIGEGIGMVVLKRLEDAECEQDRIYAVIRGIGTASDGRSKSIYAPRPEGQMSALRRAYRDAGCAPSSVGMIEAHGTGTPAGDLCEFQALNEVFDDNHSQRQYIALGSVKSQIGHTKAAAGAASLIKTALALYHKILPPTINMTRPHPKFAIETSPFYLNSETRPWIRAAEDVPRRAGVSSFGFGGINYHLVLEEYQSEHSTAYRTHHVAQSSILTAPTPEQLLDRCEDMVSKLQAADGEKHYVELVETSRSCSIPVAAARLGFVAESLTEACELLQLSLATLRQRPLEEAWEHARGIYYRRTGLAPDGKVVALFSGQGSQYLEMGRELVLNFPPLRHAYGHLDSLFSKDGLPLVSSVVFPPPAFDKEHPYAHAEALQRTEYAQAAIGAFSSGLYKILLAAGFKPDFVAGHSFGELTALWAAGVLDDEDYFALVKSRGKAMAPPADPHFDAGTMLAVKGDNTKLQELIQDFPHLAVANVNSNNQVVLAGAKPVIAEVQHVLKGKGYSIALLPVSAAFHTPFVGHAQEPFAHAIRAATFHSPTIPVYSNVTGKPYPTDPQAIQTLLADHLLKPVLFQQEIENIAAAGGYFFIEFGPKNILTNLVKDILENTSHVAVALNANSKRDSDRQLRAAVVQLRVAGLPLQDIDPYALPQTAPTERQHHRLKVRLNGSSYVSDSTKAAFENALLDRAPAPAIPPKTVPSPSQQSQPTAPEPLAAPAAPNPTPLRVQPNQGVPSHAPHVLESLEQSLTLFQSHQAETLRVHEHYLHQQTDYTKTFFQLMQQQYGLLVHRQSTPHPVGFTPGGLESLERSMMRFHELQGETLRVHEHYLHQQIEYSQHLFQLIQQQYALLTTGDAPQHLVQPAATTISPSPSVRVADSLAPHTPRPDPESQPAGAQPEFMETTAPGFLPADSIETLTHTVLEVVSDKTGYPVEMLALEMELEADLGIDSIKRVEILGTLAELYPEAGQLPADELAELRTLRQVVEYLHQFPPTGSSTPTAVPQSEPTALSSGELAEVETVAQTVLEVVSDKTGYPVEMLALEMELEADLGIDSIKRVEILGTLAELYPEARQLAADELAELRTLRQVVAHLQPFPATGPSTPIAAPPREESVPQHAIQRRVVRLKPLPAPDILEFPVLEQHICLLTDDGSTTVVTLAQALSDQGWKVVVLSFPPSLVAEQYPLPTGVSRVVLEELSERHVEQQLTAITEAYGPPGIFIHLHPPSQEGWHNGGPFSDSETSVVKHIFLMAKHLKQTLTEAACRGRSGFLTVVRLDGEFGLGGNSDFSPTGGGLFGLTKTLHVEWEDVFCRAIDLSPDLDAAQSAQCIMAELHDANCLLTEVGYTLQGRATLVSEAPGVEKVG